MWRPMVTEAQTVLATTGTGGFYLNNNQALTLGTLIDTGPLSVTAGGSINQSGVLTVAGASTFGSTVTSSNITLNTAANSLTSIGFMGNAK